MIDKLQVTANGRLRIFAPYDKEFISAIKKVPGRVWDKQYKCWVVPVFNYQEVINSLPLTHGEKGSIRMVAENYIDYGSVKAALPKLRAGLKYYPFQKDAFKFLVRRKNGLLCLDFGLGKTLTALAYAIHLRKQEKIQKVIIVCPAPLKEHWSRQIGHFFPPDSLPHEIVFGDRNTRKGIWHTDSPCYIVNYELLLRDEEFIKEFDSSSLMIICDEVTRIKNWRAHRTKVLKGLKCSVKVGLTGAPLENNLDELYSITSWLGSNVFGYYQSFKSRYYIIDDQWGDIVRYQHLDEIATKLDFIMVRYKKEEVLDDLPDLIVNDYFVELSDDEGTEYLMIAGEVNEAVKRYTEEATFTNVELLASLTLLKMYCDDPRLVKMSGSNNAKIFHDHLKTYKHSKLAELCAIMRELSGHKVVIFTQYVNMAQIICDTIPWDTYIVTGALTNKQAAVDAFASHRGDAALITTDTLAYGMNIQCADYVINYDLPYNPAVLEQRISRVHRMGQKNVVNVINLVVEGEDRIEEQVRRILAEKQKLKEAIMNARSSKEQPGSA